MEQFLSLFESQAAYRPLFAGYFIFHGFLADIGLTIRYFLVFRFNLFVVSLQLDRSLNLHFTFLRTVICLFLLFLFRSWCQERFWIFPIFDPQLLIVTLKFFGEGIIDCILRVKDVAISYNLPDVSIKLFLALIEMTFYFPVDSLEIHRLLYDLVVVRGCLGYWVHWHSERPWTFVHF